MKKYIKALIGIILPVLFLLLTDLEYVDFHLKKNNLEVEKSTSLTFTEKEDFKSLEDINQIEIYKTPDLKLLDKIVKKIDEAKEKVYIEVYIFTEKRIKKAIKEAKKRGCDVKVILEKNVYMAPNLNNKTFNELDSAGINIVRSNKENYALNHTKLAIIDDEVMISTGNYSYSSFSKNREFFMFIEDKKIVDTINKLYSYSFLGKKNAIYNSHIVLSPFYSRKKIENLLSSAKKSIRMYAQNISDRGVIEILKEKSKAGVDVKIIAPSTKRVKSNSDEYEEFKKNGISLKIDDDSPYKHAKAIVVDDVNLYVGSINFSSYSIDKNKEIGLILNNKNIVDFIIKTFDLDFVNKK